MGVFRRGRFAALGAVAGIALMVGTVPAAAQAAGAGAFNGNGSISPGLGALPAAQTFSVSGSLTGAGLVGTTPEVPVSDSCTFSGSSGVLPGGDSAAAGAGTLSGSCSGTLSITLSATYVRVGGGVVVAGSGSAGGVAGEVAASCAFVPTNVNPTTTFTVACASGAAGP